MHPKSLKWLNDILQACDLILGGAQGRTPADYEQDRFLRSAVERNFEIIGEALNRIHRTDQSTAAHISDYRAIIDFRNLLIHGYDYIDHGRVWEVIQRDVPKLRAQLAQLLREAGITEPLK
jgi:uncharacterized protein with HEPN domain